MLRFFRINDPYRLIALLILLVIASLPLLIDLPAMTIQELKGMVLAEELSDKLLYVEIIDHTAPLMAVAEDFMDFLFGRSLLGRHILALLIIFFQASYFGILLINNKAYNESNYVPALIFGFLCFFSFDLLAITPELLASTMLLFALNNIFKEIEFRVDRDSIVLNLGVYLGLSSLFVFSYSIFVVGAIFMLIVYARATFRKISLVLFGYALVHIAVFVLYYWHGNTDDLWSNFYVANMTLSSKSLVSMSSIFILGLVPVAYFVFSLFMMTREARFTKYQSQLFQVIFWWLATAIVQIWLTSERTPHSFMTFIPPVAYFIGHYLLLIRRKWIAEWMLLMLIGGLLSINFISRHDKLESVDYTNIYPAPLPDNKLVDKKILVIGDDISLFQKNQLAGYFLDWNLSRKYFEEPDFYDNLIRINNSFIQDPPDVIIDKKNLMEPVMDRIPLLRGAYRKENNLYWKK